MYVIFCTARLAQLAEHACLGIDPGALAEWAAQRGERLAPLPRPQLAINSGAALRLAALQGLGIIVQPAFLLHDDVANGTLVRLFEGEALARPLGVVYPQARWRSAALRSFVEWMLQRFG